MSPRPISAGGRPTSRHVSRARRVSKLPHLTPRLHCPRAGRVVLHAPTTTRAIAPEDKKGRLKMTGLPPGKRSAPSGTRDRDSSGEPGGTEAVVEGPSSGRTAHHRLSRLALITPHPSTQESTTMKKNWRTLFFSLPSLCKYRISSPTQDLEISKVSRGE